MRARAASLVLLLALSPLLLVACSTPQGDTVAEKRAHGAFSNTGMKLGGIATGHGYGLIHDRGAGGKAGAIAKESVGAGIDAYQLTKTGFSIDATVAGTNYWKDGKLN